MPEGWANFADFGDPQQLTGSGAAAGAGGGRGAFANFDPGRRSSSSSAAAEPAAQKESRAAERAGLPPSVKAANTPKNPPTMASTDRDVLLVLYRSTDGPNWNNNASWDTDSDLSEWHGVKVNAQGRVVELALPGNKLRGHIPKELGALSKLETLELWSNKLTGGPMKGEALDSWRARLREQQPAEPDVGKDKVIVQRSFSTQSREPAGSNAASAGGTSSPEEVPPAERSLRVQVASFTKLENLTRENREALEGVRRLIGKQTAGSSSSGTEFASEDKLRELERLIAMAKVLDEMAFLHMEDKHNQRKELALPPGSKAYYGTVRTGLGNAYLGASVVASSLVHTSKTGGMGMAGEALKVLSSAVPVVGGLASFTAAALKAGDRHIQTRRVVTITEMATDASECCLLARTLALRLADGLAAGTIPKTCKVEETRLPTMAGVDGGAGGCGWNQGVGALPDGASEEAVMEWFTGKMVNDEGNNDARKGSSAEQAGRRLGKRHLHKLLVAVGRGCLRGTNTVEEKVDRLLKVIVPEASGRPVTIPSTPEKSFVRSPVPAPPHGGGLDREAELTELKTKLEALQLADERRQAKLKALQIADDRRQAELEALQLADERRRAEHEALLSEVNAVKKHILKPQGGPSGEVDAGGGQVLSQKQETKTKEVFWQEAEDPAAVAAADHHPVTNAQLREFAALQDERHREHDAHHSRIESALDAKKNKRGRG